MKMDLERKLSRFIIDNTSFWSSYKEYIKLHNWKITILTKIFYTTLTRLSS